MQKKLNGILVLDKPAGMTSAKALDRVKRILKADKAGHAGTLDPFATGVLICCLGKATRLSRFFLRGNKTYEGVMELGLETDTQDFTGQVIRKAPVSGLARERIEEAFGRFKGAFEQKPPVYAALKHKGLPLYKWARRGKPVQKPARRVNITALEVIAIDLPLIHFRVSCSAGTYVRTLCADIGAALGCGGHLKSLCRIASGSFGIKEAVGLDRLREMTMSGQAVPLVPMAEALRGMAMFMADGQLAAKIATGRRLVSSDFTGRWVRQGAEGRHSGHIRIVDSNGLLLAVVKTENNSGKYDYCCVFHQ